MPIAPLMHASKFLGAIAVALTIALGLVAFIPVAEAVGFQQVSVPDAGDQPLLVGIWYPSTSPVLQRPLELYNQEIAPDGMVSGDRLPLIVMSHGTGESFPAHYDTAIALAAAGFVVAAVTHTGDNYRDRSYAFTQRNFGGRARHIREVIDYMLGGWPEHQRLDPKRIGAFGHSAGGFTVLLAVGAIPTFGRAVQFCADHPEAWECQQMGRVRHDGPPRNNETSFASARDLRIRAAVIAAPAAVYNLTSNGLSEVTIPLQLWSAADDKITPPQWNTEVLRAMLPVAPEFHSVSGAGHFAFVAPCSEALANVATSLCRDPPGFDRVAFHRDFNRTVVTFFAAQLWGTP
jgi:predicted dienelactone hydrolase